MQEPVGFATAHRVENVLFFTNFCTCSRTSNYRIYWKMLSYCWYAETFHKSCELPFKKT